MRRNVVCAVVGMVLSGLWACGPSISTQTRFDMQPFNKDENRQVKDGITIENKPVKELPPAFFTTVQACTEEGGPARDEAGRPVMTKVQYAMPGQLWYQVAITNDTEHVVRLSSVVVRMFDPAGNQWEPMSKDDLASEFQGSFPCPSANQALTTFRAVKLITRDAEILPHTTITGWFAFKPTDWKIPGVWKLAVYEVPIAVDEAGKVTKTTRFEIRQVVKKFVDTYRQEGAFAERKLVESKEVTD